MKTFKSISLVSVIALSAISCSQENDLLQKQSADYKLDVNAELYSYPVSRTGANEDGIKFDNTVDADYPFSLNFGGVSKEMKLAVSADASSIDYAADNDYFTVELKEYPVSVSGEGLNAIPVVYSRTNPAGGNQQDFKFNAPISLSVDKVTPTKEAGAPAATVTLPFKIASSGLRIDFTLYSIEPVYVLPAIGGATEEIALSTQDAPTNFKLMHTEGLAKYYTLLIPFSQLEGSVDAGSKVATLKTDLYHYDVMLSDKAIDFATDKLYTLGIEENLQVGLTTITSGIEDWGVEEFTSVVTGKDSEIVDGVYYIYSEAGLEKWRDAVNEEPSTGAKLMNDIALTKDWTSSTVVFTGEFDGNNKTISGLKNENIGTDNFGLISTNSGKVKNLIVKEPKLKTNDGLNKIFNVGAIIGLNKQGGLVEHCAVIVDTEDAIYVTGPSTCYGGAIVGKSESGSVIQYCSVSGNGSIYSKTVSGGIVGTNLGSVINCDVKDITVKAELTPNEEEPTKPSGGDAGAIIGELGADETKDGDDARVIASYADNVTISCGNRAGGIVGRLKNSGDILIAASYSSNMTIGDGQKAGGIVGETAGKGQIIGCYSTSVTLKGTRFNGGIIGNNVATVTSCYTTSDKPGSGTIVTAIGETEKTAMNGALTAATIKWEYIIPAETTPFPLVIQPKQSSTNF